MRPFLLLALFVLIFTSCKKDTPPAEELEFLENATIQYKKINGIDPDLTSLDIYTVPNSKQLKPVVFWVHGGGWAIGDKSNAMENKVPLFNQWGYVFVSTNYRLSPYPYEVENESKIQYPDHVIDVADAITWVHNNIEDYGGDPENIVIMGHSAGAHLVALVATDEQWLYANGINTTKLKGVVPLDTEAFNLVERINRDSSALFLNAFTLDEVAWQEASPVFQIKIDEILPKNWLLVERGTIARREILNEFAEKLETTNAKVTRIVANSYTHEDVNKKIGEDGESIITPALKQFLQQSFYNIGE